MNTGSESMVTFFASLTIFSVHDRPSEDVSVCKLACFTCHTNFALSPCSSQKNVHVGARQCLDLCRKSASHSHKIHSLYQIVYHECIRTKQAHIVPFLRDDTAEIWCVTRHAQK